MLDFSDSLAVKILGLIWVLLFNYTCNSLHLWIELVGRYSECKTSILLMWIRVERHPPRASSYNGGFLICLLGLETLLLSKATQFWNNTISPCRSNSSLGNSVLQCGLGRCSSQWVYELLIPLLKFSVLKLSRVESIVCIVSDIHNIYHSALSSDPVFPNRSIHNVRDSDIQKGAPPVPLSPLLFLITSPHFAS